MAETAAIVQNLLNLDEDTLAAQIGIRAQAIEADPAADTIESLQEPMAVPRAGWDDVVRFGQSMVEQSSQQAYGLLCTPITGEDTHELVQELQNLLDQKTTEAITKATALLAPFLVGSLGLPQSLAVLISTLLIKRLAKGTSNFICDKWKASLSANSAPAPEAASDASPEAS